ncbi:MAG TPA: type IV toxin-antitoxin system AbiEi family antitoxin domain-containing protein [Acidimicrobiales bacterium]|nr:type IV toxin-antitoxin system AbiEi family antitoxin domain-containing protein [Acidimicrobiales bacterium]
MTPSVGEAIDRVARPRRGIATARDLTTAGFSRHQIGSLVKRNLITPVQPGVFRVTGTLMSTRRNLVAACSSVDTLAASSHRAGLWIWDLSDEPPPIEIVVRTEHNLERTGVIIHRSRDLEADQITVRRGVPVTKPDRTLVDVGCVVSRRALEEAIERAIFKRLVTVAGLRRMIDEVAGRGRNGVGVLRTALDERSLGDARPESLLEPLMARLCRHGNVEGVRYQQTLTIEGRTLRPDFIIPSAMLVIEVDGLAVHGSRDALDHDLVRQNLLIAHGYQVLRYTKTHLRDPDKVSAQILRTAHKRRAELSLLQRNA